VRCAGHRRWLGPWPILRIALLASIFSPAAAAQSPDGWPLPGHDLGGQRFSPLNAIDTGTVARLVPKWTYHGGVTATFQATPIVAGGVMYVSLPFSGVAALDPATGRERWRYTHVSRVPDLSAVHAALAGRGVEFLDAPHLVARLPDHELWMAFCRDSEGNLVGLMSELPLSKG
jgi:glucose dehydrogenase